MTMEQEPSKPDFSQSFSQAQPAAGDTEGVISEIDHELWRQFAAATTPDVYYRSWLDLQCHMIPGVSDAVVVLGEADRGPFAPAAFWPAGQRNRQHLAEVAERALLERHGLVLKRESPGATSTPDLRYHVAYPIQVDGHLHGVVALDLSSRSEPQLQAVMRQLQWGAGWLEVMLHRQAAAAHTANQTRPQMALELVATLLDHERFQAAATAFVTELATRLHCERVSVGVVRRGRVRLQAVSHSANFNKKTNLARAIEAAMDEGLDQEATLVYPMPAGAAFQLTRAHETLARQHGPGALCSVPLSREGRVVGVLTLERPADTPFDAAGIELCEAIGALAGPVLEVQRRDDRWLLTKLLESLWTQLGRLFGPRYLGRKLAFICLLAVVVFFAVAEADYRVSATTILEPATKRVVVAPFDGYITEAEVRAGDLVQAGETLCRLDDRDLRLQRLKWQSQREQYVKQHRMAMAERNVAMAKVVTAQIAQAEAELALVDDQLARTQLKAPFDGMVVTGDLSQTIGAPVQRGEVLFEVAPLEAYRVMLEIDERDVAELSGGQAGHLMLSALPTTPLPFVVQQITPVSVAREGRNYFQVEAQLIHTPLHLRPGMEGIGKIDVDRRLLLWIWTHQAIDWLRLQAWSWLP
jgi:biotin carboxyl carrier protein